MTTAAPLPPAYTAVVREPHRPPYVATVTCVQHGYACCEYVYGHTLTRRWVRVQYVTRRDDLTPQQLGVVTTL